MGDSELGVPDALAPGPAEPRPLSARASFRFALSQPRAVRQLLIAGALLAFPLPGALIVHGWLNEVHQRLAHNHPDPVPLLSFRDFIYYLRRGVAACATQYAWAVAGLAISAALTLPLFVGFVGALAASNPGVWLIVALGSVLLQLAVLATTFVRATAALTRIERVDAFSSDDALTDDYRKRIRAGAVAAFASFGPLSAVALMVGLVMCGLGLPPALAAVLLASVHLREQLHRRAVFAGHEPLPLREPVQLPSELWDERRERLRRKASSSVAPSGTAWASTPPASAAAEPEAPTRQRARVADPQCVRVPAAEPAASELEAELEEATREASASMVGESE